MARDRDSCYWVGWEVASEQPGTSRKSCPTISTSLAGGWYTSDSWNWLIAWPSSKRVKNWGWDLGGRLGTTKSS